MTPENLEPNYARLFHEATAKEGEVWHEVVEHRSGYYRCSCGEVFAYGSDIDNHINQINPTYDNPRDILNRMKEYCGEEKYKKFFTEIATKRNGEYLELMTIYEFVATYILNPPALCKKAGEFLKGEG